MSELMPLGKHESTVLERVPGPEHPLVPILNMDTGELEGWTKRAGLPTLRDFADNGQLMVQRQYPSYVPPEPVRVQSRPERFAKGFASMVGLVVLALIGFSVFMFGLALLAGLIGGI